MGNGTISAPRTWTASLMEHQSVLKRALRPRNSLYYWPAVETPSRKFEIENPDSLRKILEQLIYPLRLKWRDLVDTISQKEKRDPSLKDISELVEAKSRAANHPIFGKVQSEHRPPSGTNTRSRRDGKTFVTQGLGQPFPQRPNSKEQRKELKCPCSKRNQPLSLRSR